MNNSGELVQKLVEGRGSIHNASQAGIWPTLFLSS
jgi:hypothetical protein